MKIQGGSSGGVSEFKQSLAAASAVVTDSGNVVLPRTDIGEWWQKTSLQLSCLLHADYGVTVDGSSQVTEWADRKGFANATSEAAYLAAVTYDLTGWSDGSACVRFADGCMRHDALLPYIQGGSPKSAFALFRPGRTTLQGVFTRSSAEAGHAFYQNGIRYGIDTELAGYPDETVDTTCDSLVVWSQKQGAGNSAVYVWGMRYPIAGNVFADPASVPTKAGLGCAYAPGGAIYFPQQCAMKQAGWLNEEVSVAEYKELHRMVLGSEFFRVLYLGNSLTQGGINRQYPPVVDAALGKTSGRMRGYNMGIGGIDTPTMLAQIDTYVTPYVGNACRNILVFWEVANDIDGNHPCLTLEETRQSARVVVDNAWQYVKACQARGCEVIAVTPIQRVSPTYYTANQALCCQMAADLMRQEWRSAGCVGLVEADQIGPLQDPSNLTFFVDGVHLTQVGCNLIATAVQTAVRARLVSGGV